MSKLELIRQSKEGALVPLRVYQYGNFTIRVLEAEKGVLSFSITCTNENIQMDVIADQCLCHVSGQFLDADQIEDLQKDLEEAKQLIKLINDNKDLFT